MTQILPLPCDEPEVERDSVFLHNKENQAIEQTVMKRSSGDTDVSAEVDWDTFLIDGVKMGYVRNDPSSYEQVFSDIGIPYDPQSIQNMVDYGTLCNISSQNSKVH